MIPKTPPAGRLTMDAAKKLNLVVIAVLLGYEKERKGWTNKRPTLKHPETGHNIILSKRSDTQHWLWFDRDGNRGTIVDLVALVDENIENESQALAYIKGMIPAMSSVDLSDLAHSAGKARTVNRSSIGEQIKAFPSVADVVRDAKALLAIRWRAARPNLAIAQGRFPASKIPMLWQRYQAVTVFVNKRKISAEMLAKGRAFVEDKELESTKNPGTHFTICNVAFASHALMKNPKNNNLMGEYTGWQNYMAERGKRKYFTGEKSIWTMAARGRSGYKAIILTESPLDALSFCELRKRENPRFDPDEFIFASMFGGYSSAHSNVGNKNGGLAGKSLSLLFEKYPDMMIIDMLDADEGGRKIRKEVVLDAAYATDPALLTKTLKGYALNTAHPKYPALAKRFKRYSPKSGKDWNDTLIDDNEAGKVDTVDVAPFFLVKKNWTGRAYPGSSARHARTAPTPWTRQRMSA